MGQGVVVYPNVTAGGIGRPDYSGAAITNRSAFISLIVTVPTPGTPVRLPSIFIPDGFSVTLVPLPGNAGLVYTQYLPTYSPTTRMALDNGQPNAFPVKNTNVIYLDADNANDGITLQVAQ
jgi:hypothetical protein